MKPRAHTVYEDLVVTLTDGRLVAPQLRGRAGTTYCSRPVRLMNMHCLPRRVLQGQQCR